VLALPLLAVGVLLAGALFFFFGLPSGVVLFGDVRGSAAVAFTAAQTPLAESRRVRTSAGLDYPLWGLVPQRTRYLPGIHLSPPYRVVWTLHAHALIELPPVVGYGRLYFGSHSGEFISARSSNGRIAWHHKLGQCMAASPAVGAGIVYVATMGPSPCGAYRGRRGSHGELVAFDARNGRLLWRFRTGLIESSPLLVGSMLYFCAYLDDHSGYVYAVDTRTRQVVWSAFVPAKVTSSPSLIGRTVYVASYGGYVYAFDARNGLPHWRSPTLVDLFQRRGFYATPALAWGRVFIGGLDGRMYAFGQRTGRLLWTHSMSGAVYSSAALWRSTVFVGALKGGLSALDAASGDLRWQFNPPGTHVLGSPTVIAGLVYFATREGTTYALDARTGVVVWSFPDGQYTPIVADRHKVYLTGAGTIYGLVPFGSRAKTSGAR
jgi:outer membrane protein assembly factor BamB